MNSPFVFDVSSLLGPRSQAVTITHTGPTPVRIGTTMIAVPASSLVEVEASITPLGEAVMVDATVTGELHGQCCRCLSDITADKSLTVRDVFTQPGTVVTDMRDGGADDEDDSGENLIIDDRVDIEQLVIDAFGLDLPFSPVCSDFGGCCSADGDNALERDGISIDDENTLPDPRWAGLEKFR